MSQRYPASSSSSWAPGQLSGLMPARHRPTYRERHPVRMPAVTSGFVAAVGWYVAFGLASWNVRSYVWSMIIASVLGWTAALILARYGDRGAAVGVAAVTAAAGGIAGLVVIVSALDGTWVLW